MPGNTSGAKSKIGKENFTVLLPTSLLKAQVLDDAARLAEQLRREDVEASRLQRRSGKRCGGVSPACGMRNDHRMNGHAIIAADVRQFDRLINKDGVFSTHKALKTLVRTAVTLNKSRVRS